MGLKQKVVYDAGVTSTTDIYEINDQAGRLTRSPKSSYAISETVNLAFTNSVIGPSTKNLNIADGERRPGTK
jgi:hypothetical protein